MYFRQKSRKKQIHNTILLNLEDFDLLDDRLDIAYRANSATKVRKYFENLLQKIVVNKRSTSKCSLTPQMGQLLSSTCRTNNC